MAIRKGTIVSWNWANGTASGKVEERFTHRVERTIKGKTITRNATSAEPAFLIAQDDGDRVLKSLSEIKRAD